MTAGLVGKTALITGAGRGIGAAIATGLAKAGADVILLAVPPTDSTRPPTPIAPAALTAALAPGMAKAGWGRIVNVSSSVVGHPGSMIGGNTYAATKAALEAHSRNLAAELDGTGVTVGVYRPGGVDTAMQGWIRSQDPQRIGAGLHNRFLSRYDSGGLITPQESANARLSHLLGEDGDRTGAIWDLGDTVST
jgi:NAD(P)-dependent dehydrogenase (short-subunit alcohol dehydrogenase family)